MESPSDASFNAVRGGEFHRPGHAAAVFFCQAGQRGGAIIRGSKSMRNESMRNGQAEMVTRLVREQEASEARREAEARATAHALIQGYIGPDHKVVDMPNFYSALVQAIRTARWQGQTDGPGEDVLTLT